MVETKTATEMEQEKEIMKMEVDGLQKVLSQVKEFNEQLKKRVSERDQTIEDLTTKFQSEQERFQKEIN